MKSPDEIGLVQACKSFAVANTPLFLVRKLRDDPAVARSLGHFRDRRFLLRSTNPLRATPQSYCMR